MMRCRGVWPRRYAVEGLREGMFRPAKSFRERRRARRRFEEVVAWIVLPLVLVVGWWIGYQVYAAWDVPSSMFVPNR